MRSVPHGSRPEARRGLAQPVCSHGGASCLRGAAVGILRRVNESGSSALAVAIEGALGARVRELRPLRGGDVDLAYAVDLDRRGTIFVKTSTSALPGRYRAEAEGLGWLASAAALATPEVLAYSDDAPSFLALAFVVQGSPGRDYDERLGRGLAALHRSGRARFGFGSPSYLATLPWAAKEGDEWPSFYARERLAPLVERARRAGRIDASIGASFERLFARIGGCYDGAEPPARLHGDLWAGNVLCDRAGSPVLVDPAVYGGHREMDLAMMRLFGGFGERCFRAYDEAYALAPGHEERVALHQLLPLLVHVCLFGGSYVASLERTLARVP